MSDIETHPTLSTFEAPELFDYNDMKWSERVRIDSISERVYDDEESVVRRPLGAGALKLSMFREDQLFETAGFGPMH